MLFIFLRYKCTMKLMYYDSLSIIGGREDVMGVIMVVGFTTTYAISAYHH